MSERLPEGATLGGDGDYDAEAFVEGLKARGIKPHVAIDGTVSKNGVKRKTAVPPKVAAASLCDQPAATQAHRGKLRSRKPVGGLAQVKVRGLGKVRAVFVFAIAAYDHVRLPKLLASGAKCLEA